MTQATGSPARRFRPYPAYRDSAVEWVGKIPAHWEVKRLKRNLRVVNGSTPRSGDETYWDGEICWVTPEDLGSLASRKIISTARLITRKGYESCGTTLVPVGSIVLSTRAPIGNLAVAAVPLCTNQGCRSLVPRHQLSSEFFFYELLAARSELESLGRGSTFVELGKEDLEQSVLAVPPFAEQRAIADFLDRETARIDGLIAKKEQLIELLEEKRAALITQAVTRGLDPNVPMKDSDTDWAPRVPATWSVERNKVLFRERDERSVTGAEELMTVSHITGVTRRSEKDVNMIEAESHEGYKLCQPGDLVINTMWAWMGALGVAREAGMVSPSYNVYRPNQRLLPDYFDYLCRIPAYVSELTRYSKGVWKSRLRLYPEDFMEIRTILPSAAEQESVVRFLNREVTRINGLIAKVRDAIGRLLEYRTALISAAATGKIDVRST